MLKTHQFLINVFLLSRKTEADIDIMDSFTLGRFNDAFSMDKMLSQALTNKFPSCSVGLVHITRAFEVGRFTPNEKSNHIAVYCTASKAYK